MAPKRDNKKRKPPVSPSTNRQMIMKLRSGCALDQEASSRIRALDTPPRRKRHSLQRCVLIDNKAQVDEDSNNIEEDTEITSNYEVQYNV